MHPSLRDSKDKENSAMLDEIRNSKENLLQNSSNMAAMT